MIVGVDIGGTFTDFALFDPSTGKLKIGKRLTTPDNPSDALLKGIDELCSTECNGLHEIQRVSHATTLVTNAIIEKKGGATGLFVTKGFRDVLLMGRESRYDHYDFRFERPEPLVSRSATEEIDERIGWDGHIVSPLKHDTVRSAAKKMLDRGVRSIAVCLLHSYRNPVHEREIQELLEREFPEIDCTLSSEVSPEIREYERATTATANAYVRPLVRQYLTVLDAELGNRGFRNEVQVMLSNGGLSSVAVAQKFPIQLIESGPAAGALAASSYATLLGLEKVLAFDMGGTTAKLCCIEHGKPKHSNMFEAARTRRFKKGSGLPLQIPVIELIEIGAGGGSVARVDDLGFLRVGPESAGAKPGPAAYGLGGVLPTVTDADVVLGYIDPQRFLGGDMALDEGAARQAILEHVARPLNKTVSAAAWSIFNVVNEAMVAAGRRYIAEQGLDARDFSLIVFGGAAPLHAWQVAGILGIKRLIFPVGAGAMSAVGLCVAAPAVNLSRTRLLDLSSQVDWHEISGMFADMELQAMEMLRSAGAEAESISISRTVDIRYTGQGYEIEVPISGVDLDDPQGKLSEQIDQLFRKSYEEAYGRLLESKAIEAVTWRIKALTPALSLDLEPLKSGKDRLGIKSAFRQVCFDGLENYIDCPVYDRYQLVPGDSGKGPALFEERETTVVVDQLARWEIDRFSNLVVRY